MNTMRKLISAFEYLYYRIYATYKYRWHENMPGMYALGIVMLLQYFIATILCRILPELILGIYWQPFPSNLSKLEFGLYILPLFFVNYWYFYKYKSFERLEEKWGNEPIAQKEKRGRIVLGFIIIITLLTIGLAGYVGETRNS